ncbi:MAG: 3-methyl-2-oxobutanoate hydroxymethyltransferase [bacterium]
MEKITIPMLLKKKRLGQKITMLTAYDYLMAKILDEVGIDVILVGDTLGMVLLGYPNTLSVTMEDMLAHTKSVSKGVSRSLVIADMPFMSFQVSIEETIRNAGRFIKECGAEAVKIEGTNARILSTVAALSESGIAVMGHIGLTPQHIHQMGGYKVQGKEEEAAHKLVTSSRDLEKAGAFAIVLEGIPMVLAQEITKSISIPTIGIGAGPYCDGQVLVIHDLLGLSEGVPPKFVKQYANLREDIAQAVKKYILEVKAGEFPSKEFTYYAI